MSKDYRAYAAKDITPTMVAFHEWLQNETGLELDLRSVALAGSLRMDFQKSDFWKSHEANYLANIEANREAKALKAAEAAKARLAKAQDAVKAAEAKAKAAVEAAKAKAAELEAKAGDKAA
jgi:nucleoid-associated protein YgaU